MSITARRAPPRDAAAFARIMGDPAVCPGLMQLPVTNEGIWSERLAESCAPGKPDLILAAELDGRVVGTAGLHPIGAQLRRRGGLVRGISVEPACRAGGGRGQR
jgi:L-phenylalanine/L-methionine N-acetyltransferase